MQIFLGKRMFLKKGGGGALRWLYLFTLHADQTNMLGNITTVCNYIFIWYFSKFKWGEV